MNQSSHVTTDPAKTQKLDFNVVLLVNFLAPNHVAVCQEISRRLARFTVLCSVPMESNRDWQCQWGDLDVIVQKTWTLSRTARHPSGYKDINYIHIPVDTIGQLRKLKPDAVVSLELGARTTFSWLHRFLHRRCAVVAAIGASERSEAGRGSIRRFTRRRLLQRVDWVTYNSPSCRAYLESLGGRAEIMSPWEYAADPSKPYRDPLHWTADRGAIKLLTVGQLSDRKGVLPAARQLAAWASTHSETAIDWHLLGTGPVEADLRALGVPRNLRIHFHGHCDAEEIQGHYRDNDALLFPTLGDEWGLVVDEALHSGLPVIGSVHAQAVTTLVVDNKNGWSYDPEVRDSLTRPLSLLVNQTDQARQAMAVKARQSVASRTPQTSAEQFVGAVKQAIQQRNHQQKDLASADQRTEPTSKQMEVIST